MSKAPTPNAVIGTWIAIALLVMLVFEGIGMALYFLAIIAFIFLVMPWIYARIITRTYDDIMIRGGMFIVALMVGIALLLYIFE